MKCDACSGIFCNDHIQYLTHQCPNSYQRDVQVPVCPLCNQPVPTKRGEAPDIRVGEHIDRDCQSDPATAKRKVYTSKCSQKGCKQKEMIKIACSQCRLNFCLKHRFPQDHHCQGLSASGRSISNAGAAAIARSQASSNKHVPSSIRSVSVVSNGPLHHQGRNNSTAVNAVQGTMSEDEALARALQMSLMDETTLPRGVQNSQYEMDQQLAEALAASRRQQRNNNQRNISCTVS